MMRRDRVVERLREKQNCADGGTLRAGGFVDGDADGCEQLRWSVCVDSMEEGVTME
jgi:hypothetical protein